MKKIATVVSMGLLVCTGHAENLPANLSREPHCLKNTVCLKPNDVYRDTVTLPAGFSREPKCSADVKVVCVSASLSVEAKELAEIRKLAESEVKDSPAASMRVDPVMGEIVLVSVHKANYFGVKLLLEKQAAKGWVVLRKEHSIY